MGRLPGFPHACSRRDSLYRADRQDGAMERTDLLISFLAFGAAVMTLWAWLWSTLSQDRR